MVKFRTGVDHSNNLANEGNQIIEFNHVASGWTASFKAFLTEFSDQYTSEWESTTTFGRMDPIQTFKRTGRKINIGFDVVAGSLAEARSNLERVSLLIQMLYPSYEAGNGGASTIKASPYLKMSFMNMAFNNRYDMPGAGPKISGLLGTSDGFTYTPNLDAGMYFDEDGNTYPKVINIATGFTVVHDHQLGWVATDILDHSEDYNGKTTKAGLPRGDFIRFPYNAPSRAIGVAVANAAALTQQQAKRKDEVAASANRAILLSRSAEMKKKRDVQFDKILARNEAAREYYRSKERKDKAFDSDAFVAAARATEEKPLAKIPASRSRGRGRDASLSPESQALLETSKKTGQTRFTSPLRTFPKPV